LLLLFLMFPYGLHHTYGVYTPPPPTHCCICHLFPYIPFPHTTQFSPPLPHQFVPLRVYTHTLHSGRTVGFGWTVLSPPDVARLRWTTWFVIDYLQFPTEHAKKAFFYTCALCPRLRLLQLGRLTWSPGRCSTYPHVTDYVGYALPTHHLRARTHCGSRSTAAFPGWTLHRPLGLRHFHT